MSEKQFTIADVYDMSVNEVADLLNGQGEKIQELEKERDYYEKLHCKKHNKWNNTHVEFLQYKQKVKETLQKNYEYAENQRQKNLDNNLIAHAYDVLRYTVKGIADELGIMIE